MMIAILCDGRELAIIDSYYNNADECYKYLLEGEEDYLPEDVIESFSYKEVSSHE